MVFSVTVIVALILIIKTQADVEDHDPILNMVDSPAVNFNEIFSSHLAMLTDDKTPTQAKETNKDFHLDNTQFVEFRFPKIETSTVPLATTPPPRYIVRAAYLKNHNKTEKAEKKDEKKAKKKAEKREEKPNNSTTTATPVTTEVPETTTIEVPSKIPIKEKAKENQHRGVLDLLFPSYRVKTFKSIFDTFRMVLSNTFRRR